MSEVIKTILSTHNLRVTSCRTDVVQYFVDGKGAFSQGDLEKEYNQYDRVTIYRTLNSLVKVGILHKIPNDSGASTYALCHHANTSGSYFENHIHFSCTYCGQTECLKDQEIPKVNVPEGYKIDRVNLIIDGVCTKCALS